MDLLLGFVFGIVSGLVANFFSPAFSEWVVRSMSRLLHWADKERFDLTGIWEQTCLEPTPGEPTVLREVKERVELRQLGVTVKGEGATTIDPRNFTYTMRVTRSMVFGSYNKRGQRGNITGSGMIQLILNGGSTQMDGYATWFDSDTDKIESSKVTWRRL
ncbi:hypothetical protein [Variovorax sp. 350MFTsu5.1]|uniref:hypothetical protein n=1 Tax=Variovorax sp. 350MFTsu5.1 TaxID=3158365 RepID=UPI003AAF6106